MSFLQKDTSTCVRDRRQSLSERHLTLSFESRYFLHTNKEQMHFSIMKPICEVPFKAGSCAASPWIKFFNHLEIVVAPWPTAHLLVQYDSIVRFAF